MGKRIARGAAFLAAGVLLFLFLQELLLPHYEAGATAIAGGFYRREENSVEVLSLGSSQPILGLDIPRLEETLGVSACTFGATKQRLTTTAYYLREALKTQSPRVILVELGQFFFPEEGEPLADGQVVAWSYPAMKISRDKYESLLELYEGDTARAAAQCFAPLLPYHSRWSSLTGSDIAEFFRLVDHEEIAPGGFIGSDTHSEVTVAFTGEDEGTAKRIPPTTPAAIDEIIALTEKATPPRTRLLFYKLPDADWTRADSAVVREFLAGRGYAFLDLNEYHKQIALDPAADFVDAQHLNRSGAAKVTDFLASYLASGEYLAEFSD